MKKEGKPVYKSLYSIKLTGCQVITTQEMDTANAISLQILHLMSGNASAQIHTGYIL